MGDDRGAPTRLVGNALRSCALFLLLLLTPSFASATLEKCQKAAGKGIAKYAVTYQKTVGKCLDKIAKELVKDAEADASGAAKTCLSAMRKIVNTDKPTGTLAAKAGAKVDKVCSGGPHSVADVLGGGLSPGDSIEADSLGAYCDSFGVGGGMLTTIQDWIDCQVAVATCSARQQLVAEYPNIITWLIDVRPHVNALDPNSPKVIDALTAIDALDLALDGDEDKTVDLACGPDGLVAGTDAILPKTGQTVSFGPSTDGEVEAGRARSFTDHGDGTITDELTGLMWEVKDDAGGVHDKNSQFNWADAHGASFLGVLNDACDGDEATACTADADCTGIGNGLCGHAGYRDWRMPNQLELYYLVDLEAANPSAWPAFNAGACEAGCALPDCSCTGDGAYWTSTTNIATPANAWQVNFMFGGMTSTDKASFDLFVRAVR